MAALMEDGFEEVELIGPAKMLKEAGVLVEVVSPKEGTVRSWTKGDWGDEFAVDVPLKDADPDAYDGLLLPGGVRNPDRSAPQPGRVELRTSLFCGPQAGGRHMPRSMDSHRLRGHRGPEDDFLPHPPD